MNLRMKKNRIEKILKIRIMRSGALPANEKKMIWYSVLSMCYLCSFGFCLDDIYIVMKWNTVETSSRPPYVIVDPLIYLSVSQFTVNIFFCCFITPLLNGFLIKKNFLIETIFSLISIIKLPRTLW